MDSDSRNRWVRRTVLVLAVTAFVAIAAALLASPSRASNFEHERRLRLQHDRRNSKRSYVAKCQQVGGENNQRNNLRVPQSSSGTRALHFPRSFSNSSPLRRKRAASFIN